MNAAARRRPEAASCETRRRPYPVNLYRRDFGPVRRDSPPKLIAGMPRGAVDVRIYARVIEGAGEDRHSDCTCPATTDRTLVITALPGGDTADDQPDDKKRRSDMHVDLRSIDCIKSGETANSDCQPLPWSGIPRKHTHALRYRVRYARIESLFQESGSWVDNGYPASVRLRYAFDLLAHWRRKRIRSAPAPGAPPRATFQTSGSCP